MGGKKEKINNLQAQLDEWGAQIDKLKAQSEQAEAEERRAISHQIEELEVMHETAAEILAGFKEINEDKQEVVQEVIESAWDSLGKAVRSVEAPGRT